MTRIKLDPCHPASVHRRTFGTLSDGRPVEAITLDDGCLSLTALTLGAALQTLCVPDAQGRCDNVVLGFDNLEDYEHRNWYFGVVVGRYANRIASARLVLDGEEHVLDANDGPHCLHGGRAGFGARLWTVDYAGLDALGRPMLRLSLRSPDGDQGFPGTLLVSVTYRLDPGACWHFAAEAMTDRATVVNLSHHAYFDLSGSDGAMGHELTLACSRRIVTDEQAIPTGIAPVEETPFDFRHAAIVGTRLQQAYPQARNGEGFDHHYILDRPAVDGTASPVFAARLRDPACGRSMELWTTEPGLQLYSSNHFDGTLIGRGGRPYARGAGLCLEPQHCPDSPHHPDWPSTVLRPGQLYRTCSEFRFGI